MLALLCVPGQHTYLNLMTINNAIELCKVTGSTELRQHYQRLYEIEMAPADE